MPLHSRSLPNSAVFSFFLSLISVNVTAYKKARLLVAMFILVQEHTTAGFLTEFGVPSTARTTKKES